MTEYGDRINQLDFNITKTVKIGRLSVQPKFDLFSLGQDGVQSEDDVVNWQTASDKI